jgi:multiple sugar transport system substrate-binding protein
MWEEDPVMAPYRVAGRGPPSAKAAEVLSKYIITDMYAKAIQGGSAEDAVKWAESELKKVYV